MILDSGLGDVEVARLIACQRRSLCVGSACRSNLQLVAYQGVEVCCGNGTLPTESRAIKSTDDSGEYTP